jgi:hypothetical protein
MHRKLARTAMIAKDFVLAKTFHRDPDENLSRS